MEGKTVAEAAKAVGTKPRFMTNDVEVQALVADLVAKYTLTADMRKKLSRAVTNQAVLDPDVEWKDKLKAIQILNDDPEVGLGGGPAVAVQNNFAFSSETSSLLQSFELGDTNREIQAPQDTPSLIDGVAEIAEVPEDQNPS